MKRGTLLFLIIFLEGYVVLASELLAIRQLLPFVGSGTEVVAIIISAVLLPLAVGYHHGGRVRGHLRRRLMRNFLVALGVLTLGLSYLMLEVFFAGLNQLGLRQPVLQTTLYSLAFLVYPIYLLGQTAPIISNYLRHARLSETTGRVLYFSTIGSFCGSVFSTLVLMNTIGVHLTVIVTLGLLTLTLLLICKKRFCDTTVLAAMIFLLAIAANSPASLRAMKIVSDNAYNTVAVHEDVQTGNRVLSANRSASSGLSREGARTFPYIQYVETNFINPLLKAGGAPREILVIGAGGFTVGLEDTHNRYQFVDIDAALKEVSETHFLKQKLTPNKQFTPASARAFVKRAEEKYDLIFIDTFTNVYAAPMETTTREFLLDAKNLLKPGGALIVNQIASADFGDRFSLRYDRTFASVFGIYTRQVMGDFNPWAKGDAATRWSNVLYIYYDRPELRDDGVYTDDKNSFSLDRYRD